MESNHILRFSGGCFNPVKLLGPFGVLVGREGFEPPTPAASTLRSTGLSYLPETNEYLYRSLAAKSFVEFVAVLHHCFLLMGSSAGQRPSLSLTAPARFRLATRVSKSLSGVAPLMEDRSWQPRHRHFTDAGNQQSRSGLISPFRVRLPSSPPGLRPVTIPALRLPKIDLLRGVAAAGNSDTARGGD